MDGQHQNTRRVPIGVIAGISAAVLVAGGGAAWWTLNSPNTGSNVTTAPAAPANTQNPSSTAQAPAEAAVQVYWLQDTGTQLKLTTRTVQLSEAAQPEAALEGAFQALLSGPESMDVATTIPAETDLLALSVEPDGVHVNLSEEFEFGGGSTAMTGRLGQVIYTATVLDPSAPVWISVEGEPLKVLGGEGIMVNQPMTREEFNQEFGSIVSN
jgi:spore germination protein GerM